MDIVEINTTLEALRLGQQWWTKDDQVTFLKMKEGWVVGAYSYPTRKVFEEYGITSMAEGEHTCFPSLKTARQAVNDVSLEAGLNIDSGLTRQRWIAYKIGDLPLSVKRDGKHWRVYAISSDLPQSFKKYFNSVEEFKAAWESTDIALAHYPTRKAAHQAVVNRFSQTIAE
jgi:hypothetical protein